MTDGLEEEKKSEDDVFEERKLAADELVKAGEFGKAAEAYRQCLCNVKVDGSATDERKKDLFVKTCCNASLACARCNRGTEALLYAEKALSVRSDDIKALYRRAHALRILGNLTEASAALSEVEQVLKAQGKTLDSVQNERKALQAEINKFSTACSLATLQPGVQQQITDALHKVH